MAFPGSVLRYVPGKGFLHDKSYTDILSIFLSLSNIITKEGVKGKYDECSFTDLRKLPLLAKNVEIDGEPIVHWEFPTFSTLELNQDYLERLFIENRNEYVNFGSKPSVEIGYIANKSDGRPYNMFSCYTTKWHSFAHCARKLYYLGESYRVGHVELVGQVNISTHYIGTILLNGVEVKVHQKPLFSQCDPRGHKEGVIVEVFGIEHRVKVERTHDLVVTHVDSERVQVETNDQLVQCLIVVPRYPIDLGTILECVEGYAIRSRPDKRVAEGKPAYDRVEQGISFIEFNRRLKVGISLTENKDRYQVMPLIGLIADRQLSYEIPLVGSMIDMAERYPQYHPRDLARTIQSYGAIFESTEYVLSHHVNYDKWLEMYDGKFVMLPGVVGINKTNLFDFRDVDVMGVKEQEQVIIDNCDLPIVDSYIQHASEDLLYETAVRIVEETLPKDLRMHTKMCSNQILKWGVTFCPLCAHNNAVKFLVDKMASYSSMVCPVSGIGPLYRRNNVNHVHYVEPVPRVKIKTYSWGFSKR